MNTTGRNDPCYCGSGKKYKACHWREDQQAAAQRAAREQARLARLAALGQPPDGELRGLFEEMTGQNAPTGPISGEARTMLVQTWQQRKLNEQGRAALEPEWEQWSQHFADEATFDEVARGLASDPMFNDYQLTDENREKVLAELGEWPDDPALEHDFATRAIAITLDDEDRATFSDTIATLIPDLVEEGRMADAFVAATCAERVRQPEARVSPFLADVVQRSLRTD